MSEKLYVFHFNKKGRDDLKGTIVFLTVFFLEVLTVSAISNFQPSSYGVQHQELGETLKIMLVGDVIFHKPIIDSAETSLGYDFKRIFEDIRPFLISSDVAIFNLEGVVSSKYPPSGYPNFNAPDEIINALKYAGFNGVVLANNHCLDKGLKALEETLGKFKKVGIKTIGVGEKIESRIALYEKYGIRVSVLGFTQFVNGYSQVPNYIGKTDLEEMKNTIDIAKRISDFVIVYVHYGSEYVREPEQSSITLLRSIADMGADLIVGNHPHVVRRNEFYTAKDGRKVIIAYSVGNFVSNQDDKYTDVGLLLNLAIQKNGEKYIYHFESLPVYRLRYRENGKLIIKVVTEKDFQKYKDKIGEEKYFELLKIIEEIKQMTK